jgi:hypothetical protein
MLAGGATGARLAPLEVPPGQAAQLTVIRPTIWGPAAASRSMRASRQATATGSRTRRTSERVLGQSMRALVATRRVDEGIRGGGTLNCGSTNYDLTWLCSALAALDGQMMQQTKDIGWPAGAPYRLRAQEPDCESSRSGRGDSSARRQEPRGGVTLSALVSPPEKQQRQENHNRANHKNMIYPVLHVRR